MTAHMLPDQFEIVAEPWASSRVMVFAGQHDTHIATGEDYSTAALAHVFDMGPTDKPKAHGWAFIPSSYNNFDGREHAVQRAHGTFVALTGDIDKGDHALARIETLVRGFALDAAWLIYSSAHARPGDMRWRVIIPLAEPLAYDDWRNAQHAFFTYMEAAGVQMDRALDRAGQPVYLPNVPAIYAKTGERLRGDDGKPLYFVRSTTGITAPGLPIDHGPVAAGIKQQREADDRAREDMRRKAEARRAANRIKTPTDGHDVIGDFNRAHSIAILLERYGYAQSPRRAEDWRSPFQTSGSYATRDLGEAWVSLSASDAAKGIGATCKAGCFGDAFDLFVHFEHDGDMTAALRALHDERRVADAVSASNHQKGAASPEGNRAKGNRASHGEATDPETGEVFTVDGDVSEDAIALAFTSRFRDTLRYDHDARTWFEWDGTRWRKDGRDRAFSYARELGRILSRGDKGERGLRKASVAGGAERFARSDPAHAVDASVWDTDPMLLGTPAGTIDLRTGRMRKASPGDYITKQTAVAPESGSPDLWMEFLREALGDDESTIRFLQQWCGYCLSGLTTEHALFFIYGPGGNGKSVFLNTIAAILGDYAVTAAMETFTASKFDRHSTELAMLAGARMVTASETEEGRTWAEAKVKQMTGGDPITARFMHKDNFTYRPQFKLTIAGNHAPALRNVDDAMRRRFNIVPFTVKPAKPDRQLEEKLRAEHGKILGWAIKGCLDWQAEGLVRPAAVTEATGDYFESQDLFGQWIADCCETGPTKWEQPTRLYNSWCAYARDAGEDPGPAKTFNESLKKRGFPSRRTGPKGRFHDRIALKPQPTAGHHSDGSDGW